MNRNRKMPKRTDTGRKVIYQTTLSILRKEKGMTPIQVAAGAGLASGAMVENAEKGYGLRLDTAFKIAKFFDKPIESIWDVLPGAGGGK